jgi:nodulation protein E
MPARRVAITGLGAVSALGVGVPAFWNGLLAGRSGVRRITLCDANTLASPIAAEVPDFDAARWMATDRLSLLDRFSQFALAAADEAFRHAGLSPSALTPERTGAAIGSAFGGKTSEDEQYRRLYGEGARVHPFTIPRLMNNAAASQISMRFGIGGPTLSYGTACAAGSHAVGEGFEIIRSGRAEIMVSGGSDAPIALGVMKAWEAMRVLAPEPPAGPAGACRPFSRDRQGLVVGEGAGILILEEWNHARQRGATILAELAGYGATADAGHVTQPGVEAPARALQLALVQASLDSGDIDYINAHGTGTRLNDATETAVIHKVFGSHARSLAISSTKSMHGHAMGASGALELIATVLALQHSVVPPTANYRDPDPECDLDYVPNEPRQRRVRAAVSNSFGFGGLNAVLVVRAPGIA